jgi:two-component system LytT family response regulator
VNQETYLLRETLTALEKKLDPTQFIRLHRSAIVNVDRIKELAPWCGGEQAVFLLDGTQLTIGRAFRDRITALLKNCG